MTTTVSPAAAVLPMPMIPADGAVALTHWGLISAQGADAARFLHSQLTQDVEHLDSGHARLAGYCSAKGRLLATFVVWRPQPEEVFLACSADVLPATLKRLSMFVLRAKCKLADAGAAWRLVGLAGPSALAWAGAAWPAAPWRLAETPAGRLIRLPDAAGSVRALLVQPAGDALPDLPALPLAQWQALEVASGVPTVTAATVEQFVPQMVNLELVGGVNFQKGCYPGQEVVARSQYRGTLKRRAFLWRSDAPAAAGQEVFAVDDPSQPAGMVVNAASLEGIGHLALLEVKLAALGQSLHLGVPGGPALYRLTMPYPVPLEAS
ncbi:folate-binding protein [Calidifontimicrobium sp. SYSU G02091]|uniref:CAF17-like 4Fe-4S cluster assembly/insertion protein YgfZ n=1 Tax=Calidifontimicrobium sp. SYSU G02091 TaxID=2926421 RepID=UPI001F5382C2|nr:folate-binding protein [Calidifontimicrobium sp. SYSU G02091]MCI1192078.1 folate-binding protein [Calidifontimicrobium sp. SYSU G02091]